MRVLIVDDSQAIRRLLRRTIEKETSFSVVGEACNGADAIEATERKRILTADIEIGRRRRLEMTTLTLAR